MVIRFVHNKKKSEWAHSTLIEFVQTFDVNMIYLLLHVCDNKLRAAEKCIDHVIDC
jgi:hypothetical protein